MGRGKQPAKTSNDPAGQPSKGQAFASSSRKHSTSTTIPPISQVPAISAPTLVNVDIASIVEELRVLRAKQEVTDHKLKIAEDKAIALSEHSVSQSKEYREIVPSNNVIQAEFKMVSSESKALVDDDVDTFSKDLLNNKRRMEILNAPRFKGVTMRTPHYHVIAPDKRTKISIVEHLTMIGILSYAMQATQVKVQNIGSKVIKTICKRHYYTNYNNSGITRQKRQQKRKSANSSFTF